MWPHALGHYKVTGEEHEGAAVYKNGHGTYLYKLSNGTWRASYEIGDSGWFKSVDTALCPDSTSQWRYDATSDNGNHSGDITVQCSVHT